MSGAERHTTSALVDVMNALEARDDEALLEALLRVWRKHRIASIADAIDVVSARHVEDVPWPATWAKAKTRVTKLAASEADPRIAASFVRLLEEMPWTSIASAEVYALMVRAIVKIGDVRGVEKLRELAGKRNKHFEHEEVAKLLKRAATEAAKFAGNVVPLEGSDEATWREIESALLGSKEKRRDETKVNEDFLREILADPDDETPRRVYADWLIERNDPLGELIVLQCERAAERSNKASLKREKELLQAHRAKWLGPIAGIVGKDGATFERGFLARVDMKLHGDDSLKSLIGDPRWSTVRAVSFGFYQTYRSVHFDDDIVAFLHHDTTRALRFVQGAETRPIVKALEGRVFPWEALAISWPLPFCEDPTMFDRPLPGLRHLGLPWVESDTVRAIVDTPVFDRIETLSTGYSGAARTLADWTALLARRSGQKLRVVRLHDDAEPWILDAKVPLILRRDDQGKWTHLRIEGRARPSTLGYFAEDVVQILEAAQGIERVEVEIFRGVTDAHKAPIEAYAKRARLDLTFV